MSIIQIEVPYNRHWQRIKSPVNLNWTLTDFTPTKFHFILPANSNANSQINDMNDSECAMPNKTFSYAYSTPSQVKPKARSFVLFVWDFRDVMKWIGWSGQASRSLKAKVYILFVFSICLRLFAFNFHCDFMQCCWLLFHVRVRISNNNGFSPILIFSPNRTTAPNSMVASCKFASCLLLMFQPRLPPIYLRLNTFLILIHRQFWNLELVRPGQVRIKNNHRI